MARGSVPVEQVALRQGGRHEWIFSSIFWSRAGRQFSERLHAFSGADGSACPAAAVFGTTASVSVCSTCRGDKSVEAGRIASEMASHRYSPHGVIGWIN